MDMKMTIDQSEREMLEKILGAYLGVAMLSGDGDNEHIPMLRSVLRKLTGREFNLVEEMTGGRVN